jgi:hypothetical protein
MDKVAQVLAFYARHRASDPKYASPFAYAAFQVGFKSCCALGALWCGIAEVCVCPVV